jgi:hypothetical protein
MAHPMNGKSLNHKSSSIPATKEVVGYSLLDAGKNPKSGSLINAFKHPILT